MDDIRIDRYCDHTILDEFLAIDGVSPNYYSDLKHISNKDTSIIDIRDWNTTEGMTNYTYLLNGMTNWSLSSDGRKINFNTLGIGASGVASFVDGSTLIYPSKQYVIKYRTLRETCPKCSGKDYTKDINFDEYGKVEVLQGIDKLVQYIRKAILTELGNNPFFESYGSNISKIIGNKFDLTTQANLQNYINETINYLIDIQRDILDLPSDETLAKIDNIRMIQDDVDPRLVRLEINIINLLYEEAVVTLKLFL